jgi:hypothetical protein
MRIGTEITKGYIRLSTVKVETHLCLASPYSLLVLLVLLGTALNLEKSSGVSDVCNLYQDAFLELLFTNNLVHFNTDTTLGHVEYATSAAVVVLVRHTGVDGRVGGDVYHITTLVCVEVSGEPWQTILAEWARELVTCVAAGTSVSWHSSSIAWIAGQESLLADELSNSNNNR